MLNHPSSASNAERESGARCEPPTADLQLIEAATAHARQTRGLPVLRVSLLYGDGSELRIPVPGVALVNEVTPATIPFPTWPPSRGWAFRAGEVAFNGTRFKLNGKLQAILRKLAAHPDEPVTNERLKVAVWHEEADMVEDNNLQGHLSLLRKKLRNALGLGADFDPIPHADGAYTLEVPTGAEEANARAAA